MKEKKKRILVVDDSRMIREAIKEELNGGGYQVVEAKNGFEALAIAASDTPPDLITLDVEMPKMNGFETCRRLQNSHYSRFFSKIRGDNTLPVVFITNNDTLADRRKGFELGAADFITKPFTKGMLLSVVEQILSPEILAKNVFALVADDDAVSRKVTTTTLAREGLGIIEAEDGLQAYEILKVKRDEIDIIITDLVMPQMNGRSLCRKIRKELAMPDTPIIALTAVSDLSELLEVFKQGASDYLVKPFAKEELLARIRVHIERNRINKKLRETVENLKKANEKIRRLSVRDQLTGCFNRGYLNSHLPKEIKRVRRSGAELSIALADIDHFKRINDAYGHQSGDHVLKDFVETLQANIRRDIDWVARYGGEEFAIIFPETGAKGAAEAAEKMRKAVEKARVSCNGQTVQVTTSFGVAGLDASDSDVERAAENLLSRADKCLYAAKRGVRNQVIREESSF